MISQDVITSHKLKMNSIYFKYFRFEHIGTKQVQNETADVKFKETHTIQDSTINIKINCYISINNLFNLDVCLVGIFTAEDNTLTERLLPNAIAIMFPYLRSQVSLLTAQPNVPTIVLPPVNINTFLKKSIHNN